ncbi:MAG: hypothetical protein FWG11_05030, partial [Promicromonosporaceae bacterium]|nr:hypothetical protein [Promicromonosporaceae bacterium]
RVIDASTAHRTAEGWAYGFPELSRGHFEACALSGRVANPGCHAAGFIALIFPLVRAVTALLDGQAAPPASPTGREAR